MASFLLDTESVIGATVIAVASIIAIICLLSVLLHMTFVVAASSYSSRMSSPQERYFITSPLGFYLICLLASNLMSSLGGVMELQWVGPKAITQGPACTTQAYMVQLGSNAEALWLGVISISALRTFMFRARPWRKAIALPLIAILWIFMVVINAAGSTIFHNNSLGFYYGASGIWCWITPNYATARIITYAWMWIWSFISAVSFLLVFLSVRGNIVVRRGIAGTTIRWRKRSFNSYVLGNGEEHFGHLVGTVGKTMAWFPIVYITLTLPLGLTRIIETDGFLIPAYAMAVTSVVYALLGVANTILYFAIRHSLKHSSLHISSDITLRGSYGTKSGTESFYSPPEKRPSPVNKISNCPWISGPTTKEWVPPSPHRIEDSRATSPSIYSPRSPRPLPPVPSAHRPMRSTSLTASTTGRLPTVPENAISVGSRLPANVPPLAIPPPAVLPSNKAFDPNAMSPVDTEMINVPLTPSPDRNESISSLSSALMEPTARTPITPTGPVPPPRKVRRSPIPSVPIDVDESDEGSICSAAPSVEAFPPEVGRHLSVGDVANRNPSPRRTRIDSMKSFWAAYEDASPKTPDMPLPADAQTIRSRDTMRTFWAAYEDPSPQMPTFPEDLSKRPESTYPESIISPDIRPPLTKPSHFSTVGGRAAKDDSDIKPPPVPSLKAAKNRDHRRSRSYTPVIPKPPPAFSLTPSVSRQPSANAVDTSKPQSTASQVSSALRAKGHSPTPSASGSSYRPPRPQPGYL